MSIVLKVRKRFQLITTLTHSVLFIPISVFQKTTTSLRRVQWSSTFCRLVDSLHGPGRIDPGLRVPTPAPHVAIALSGGVDSAVVALCSRLLQHSLLWRKVFRREEQGLALRRMEGEGEIDELNLSSATRPSMTRLCARGTSDAAGMTVSLCRWKWNEDEAALVDALQELNRNAVDLGSPYPILSAWHMRNWTADAEDGSGQRTGSGAVDCQDGHQRDAEEVARRLQLPLQFLDFSTEYWHHCFTPMINELEQGRILNPDILCNSEIKFERMSKTISLKMDQMLREAPSSAAEERSLQARRYLATGHYATLLQPTLVGSTSSTPLLVPLLAQPWTIVSGKDRLNDQTHFLARVSPAQFAGSTDQVVSANSDAIPCEAIFPLGELFDSKADVRRFARLGVNFIGRAAEKKTSVGICFVGRRSWKDFASQYLEDKSQSEGRVLGSQLDSEPSSSLKLSLLNGDPLPASLSLNPSSPPNAPDRPRNLKLYVVGEKLTFYDLENKERRATKWRRQRSFYVQRKCSRDNIMYLVEGDANHPSLLTQYWFAVDLVHHLPFSLRQGIKGPIQPEMYQTVSTAVADYRKWFSVLEEDASLDRFLTVAGTANQASLVQWRALVSCRHLDPPAWATVVQLEESEGEAAGAMILFDKPRRAAASGQGAVFQLPLYETDDSLANSSVAPNVVVAMGWIRSPLG
jgi:tRNA U34 2-thiouridine synthase MnmA/TrmU